MLDGDGEAIGTTTAGNAYGFGTINLFRRPIDETTTPEALILFPGNTGADTSRRTFANDSHTVTEFAPQPFVDGLVPPSDLPPIDPFVEETPIPQQQEDIIARFAAEFGAGIIAPFVDPEDNVFDDSPNVEPVPQVDVPEPNNILGMISLASLLFVGRRLKGFAKK